MNILMLCNKLPYPANDGSSIAMARMIEGFSKADCKTTVLCINTIKHFKDPKDIPLKLLENTRFEVVSLDTNPTLGKAFMNLFQKLPFHVSRFYQPEVAAKLAALLQNNIFDVVQIEGVFLMPYMHLIRKYSTAKIVLRAHNVEHQIWARILASTKNPVVKVFLKTQIKKLKNYEIAAAKMADAIVPIAETDMRFFKRYNEKILTVPCGITTLVPVEKICPNAFFHLGAMDWLPNVQGVDWLLREVWPKVFAQNNLLKLHLAGRCMPESYKEKNIPGVFVHGEVADASKFRKNHGIMLVPLLAGSGMRIKIVDALAQGLPIIATPIGAEGIDIENGKNGILAQNAEAFATAMLTLVNSPEKCSELGKNAALLAHEKFLNQELVNGLLDFYKSAWNKS